MNCTRSGQENVEFITITVELSITNHDSDRAEVQAFRDKTSYGTEESDGDGCNSGRNNCINRPGPRTTGIMLKEVVEL